MKYNKWSLKRIIDGTKTLTSRKKSHDDDYEVSGVVGPLPWGFIKLYLYRDEGAESPEELQRVINQIFRREVKHDEMFFVHVLIPERVLEMQLEQEVLS